MLTIIGKAATVSDKPNSTYKVIVIEGEELVDINDLVSDVQILHHISTEMDQDDILPALDLDNMKDWVAHQCGLLDPTYDMMEMVDCITDSNQLPSYSDSLLKYMPDDAIKEYAEDHLGMVSK